MARKLRAHLGVFGLMLLVGLSASAFWPNKLSGDFHLGGESLIDPSKGELQNTHFYMHIEDTAAQTLFDSMKVKATYDVCLDDGSVTKRIKNMQCTESKDGKKHDCYFGIDIEKQTIVPGVTC